MEKKQTAHMQLSVGEESRQNSKPNMYKEAQLETQEHQQQSYWRSM